MNDGEFRQGDSRQAAPAEFRPARGSRDAVRRPSTRGAQEAGARGALRPRGCRGEGGRPPATSRRASLLLASRTRSGRARPVDSSAKIAEAERKIKEERDATRAKAGMAKGTEGGVPAPAETAVQVVDAAAGHEARAFDHGAQGGARDQGEERVRAAVHGRLGGRGGGGVRALSARNALSSAETRRGTFSRDAYGTEYGTGFRESAGCTGGASMRRAGDGRVVTPRCVFFSSLRRVDRWCR